VSATGFNAEQWARSHETLDDTRFEEVNSNLTNIWRVLAFAGTMLIGLLAWSLQVQYTNAQKQLDAIAGVQLQLSKAEKPS
jgi:hypothetical protein